MIKQIILYVFSLLFPKDETIYIKEYMIDTKYIPQEIVWIDDINVLLSSSGYTEIFNTNNRKNNIIETCENCIYGYDFGFIYCRYINRNINSWDEFSTTIEVYDINDDLLFSKDIFPTVVPTVCRKDFVILKTNDPNLEEKTYILDIESNTLNEDFNKEVQREWYSKDMKRKIIIGEDYRLWVYVRNK
ncbi:hypothetical protein KBB42_00295 [Candidatus Dojkabacteria bacterium]|nr:hypothetical protein [Candidatus Dojkabacteria bacterium]